jgi:hypothetical protein
MLLLNYSTVLKLQNSQELVLQEVKVWADEIGFFTTPYSNTSEFYFEDNDVEGLVDKLNSSDIFSRIQIELTELDGGQNMVRFYVPSGNLIEVRTQVNHN